MNHSNLTFDLVPPVNHWPYVQAVLIVDFLIEFYISACLLRFGLHTRYLKAPVTSTRFVLITTAILCPLSHLIFFTSFQVHLTLVKRALDDGTAFNCDTSILVFRVLYYVGCVPPYFFLWYRQHAFYQQPLLHPLNTRTYQLVSAFTVASSFSIFLVLAANSIVGTFFEAVINFEFSNTGCVIPTGVAGPGLADFIGYALFFIGLSTILVGLYVYPLARQWLKSTTANRLEPDDFIYRALQKAVVSLFITICYDAAIPVIITLAGPLPKYANSAVYAQALTVRTIATVFCYNDHKEFLWSALWSKGGEAAVVSIKIPAQSIVW